MGFHTALQHSSHMTRTFDASSAKGGVALDNSKTAILFIEYQNEFTTEGGKLYPAVKDVMESTGMLTKSAALATKARDAGVRIFHAPILSRLTRATTRTRASASWQAALRTRFSRRARGTAP